VKLLRVTEQERIYALQPAELQMLLIVVSSFPLRDRSQTLSKCGDSDRFEEAQKLLDDALEEGRQATCRELQEWLQADGRFRKRDEVLEWRIENDRREWLLKIFNDVRVGAWTELGSPEDLEQAHQATTDADATRRIALMDMAGMLQTALLLDGEAE
jgi:hypothetical protein